MEVKFNRRRLLSIDSAINMGRYITSPKEGHEWSESELLLLAGVALSHVLFRRERRRVRESHPRTNLRIGVDRSA